MAGHVKSQLSAYLAGGLMETQKRQVDSHLAECEKCRQYLAKLRSKEARSKRDALKSAMPQQGNLFVNRISRQQAPLVSPPSSAPRWMFFFLCAAILVGAGVKWKWFDSLSSLRHKSSPAEMPAAPAPEPAVSTMTLVAVSSADVVVASSAAVPAPTDMNEANPTQAVKPVVLPSTSAAVVASTPTAVVPETLHQRQWKGSFCLIKDSREIVLSERDVWRTLWHEMNGEDSKTPRVDFDRQMVVGIFLGEKPVAGYTVSLLPAKEENGQIVIHYVVAEPPANQPAATVIVHPYHLMTIPKTDKKIVFIKGA